MFEQECLREYAETFPAVCGDFAFYQFPTEEFWRKLFLQTPGEVPLRVQGAGTDHLQGVSSARALRAAGGQGKRGVPGRHACCAKCFCARCCHTASKSRRSSSNSALSGGATFEETAQFLERLDPFLAALPPEFRYAVEIRNPEFLERDYFACLRHHGVAHVYNAWSRMPELRHQIAIPDSATAGFQVCRALLRRGRLYEEAVQKFAPYREVQDPNPEARDSMRVLIGRARENKEFFFLFVNNRLEGNAPMTILSLVDP